MGGLSVHTENLSKRFNREWILKNFTYDFLPEQCYAITGPNGSGKSTLMQVLWGQLPASSGKVLYKQNEKFLEINSIYQHVSIATPYMDLVEEFTLQEQLTFHFKAKKRRNNLTNDQILGRMQLEHARTKAIRHFSSGMKQRLKLALAFYTHAEMVFLDEPSTNLDKTAFSWYKEELEQINGKCLVFLASNEPLEIPKNAIWLHMHDFK